MIFAIVLAVILFTVAISLRSANPVRFATAVRLLQVAAVMVAAIGFLLSCIIQIGPGRVGVVVLFGKVQSTSLESGLHLINPLAEVVKFDVRTQNYTMSGQHSEGDQTGDDAIRVLSADGLEVIIDLTVLYRVSDADAPRILREVGVDYTQKIVRPITRTRIRDNAVYFDAVALYSTKRDEFQHRIQTTIEADLRKRGLVMEQLLIRNINLPESVKRAIESKINAEQESQKMQFVLAKERQEADRKRVEAQGIADYQRIMQQNLTDRQLQYELIKAQKDIALSPNAKVIILDGKTAPVLIQP